VFKRGSQGLHGRAWQLQTLKQSAISQKMTLATGLIQLAD
jgi:hypothetical protein